MKELFPEYYYSPDFPELWNKAIFVFDANVLLDLYRLSPSASNELFSILEHLKTDNRIWLPHQFANEYHKNLISVRNQIAEEHKDKENDLKEIRDQIAEKLGSFKTRSEFTVDKAQRTNVSKAIQQIISSFSEFVRTHEGRLESENLKEKTAQLFASNVGCPYPEERLTDIYAEGKSRFNDSIPPGYKDKDKPEPDCYADLVAWFQIIDYACSQESPIIAVTNDTSSDDWFYKYKGRLQGGPRLELVKEMRDKANVDFYLYTTATFVKYASTHFQTQVSHESIEEISNLDREYFENVSKRFEEMPSTAGSQSLVLSSGEGAIYRVDFYNADLRCADLRRTLQETDFHKANLQGVDLREALVLRCNMSKADLSGALLRGARFYNTEFSGSMLPDGTPYYVNSKLERFTDPAHPEYWKTHNKVRIIRQMLQCD